MTSSYAADFAIVRYGRFLRLLGRWRASVYKVVLHYLAIYLAVFYIVNLTYYFALDEDQQLIFRSVVAYCAAFGGIIPMSFILGFFLGLIIQRWWDQYLTIPWPDPVAILVSSLIIGNHEACRIMRRTIIRYLNLSITLTLIGISPPLKKRFNNDQKLIDYGLLNQNEAAILNKSNAMFPKLSKYWMPIVWACSICIKGRYEGMIRDDFTLNSLLMGLNNSRLACHKIFLYDLIPIPLVYTQVVTLVCYTYFAGALLTHQFSPTYVPILLIMEFILYIGLLKVAEITINPFGEDEEDYELNWLVDRNLQVSYVIVDEMNNSHPELLKDAFWEMIFPDQLPYGREKVETPPIPSTARLAQPQPRQALHTIYSRKDLGTISPNESYELDIHKKSRRLNRRGIIRFGLESSELSLIDQIDDSEAQPEEEQEEYYDIGEEEEEETDNSSGIGPDAFDLLKEERDRTRSARQRLSYLPFKLQNAPSKIIRKRSNQPKSIKRSSADTESSDLSKSKESSKKKDKKSRD